MRQTGLRRTIAMPDTMAQLAVTKQPITAVQKPIGWKLTCPSQPAV